MECLLDEACGWPRLANLIFFHPSATWREADKRLALLAHQAAARRGSSHTTLWHRMLASPTLNIVQKLHKIVTFNTVNLVKVIFQYYNLKVAILCSVAMQCCAHQQTQRMLCIIAIYTNRKLD